MNKIILLFLLSTLFGCQNETINSVYNNIEFWENLRLDTESDNVELNIVNDLDNKRLTIRFINSKFKFEDIEPYKFYADSLINYIYETEKFDSSYSYYHVEFINGDTSNEIEYPLNEVYASFGLNRIKDGKFKEAIDFFNKAIANNPDKASFYFNKAHCLFEIEKHKESLIAIKKYKKLDGDEKRVLILSARNYKALGDKIMNVFHINKLKNRFPEYILKEIDTLQ